MYNALLSALGIAKKAGKLVSGSELVLEAIKNKSAKVTLYAADISEGSEKKLVNSAAFYQAEIYKASFTKEELGKAIGRGNDVAAVAVTDENLARLAAAKM